MAGDWIKVEHTTPDKPEVDQLANAIGIDHDAAFGKLIRFWIWADQQSISGNALSVTPAFIDRLTNCSGFADGLLKVGWLISRNGRFSVPNFDRHNGQTAKARALTADRVKRSRNAHDVTEPLPEKSIQRKKERKRGVNKKQADKKVEHFTPEASADLIERARLLYRRLDPTHYPWIALEAELSVDLGYLTMDALETLVERCIGGSNFANALKERLGAHWMPLPALKLAVQERGIHWQSKWERPAKQKQVPQMAGR